MKISTEKIRELSIERYGNDPHLWGKQRDGFVVGFKKALELDRNEELKACSDEGTPITDEYGKKICNCLEPDIITMPGEKYECMKCWGEWSR